MAILLPLTKDNMQQNYVLTASGDKVSINDRSNWSVARNNGVSASDINKIVSPTLKVSTQQEKLLRQKLGLESVFSIPNKYTTHGEERESIVLDWARGNFGVNPNEFLFHGDNLQHFATPDGLTEKSVVEVKTSMKPLSEITTYYMNQIQWQIHVMNAEKCLFLVEMHKDFNPLQIEVEWIERDEERIKFLQTNVDVFLERLNDSKKKTDR
jgi:hypothetical protein